MEDFDGGEAFELQTRIEFFQRSQHAGVVAEGNGGMEAADDVQFGDADAEGALLRDRLRLARVGDACGETTDQL